MISPSNIPFSDERLVIPKPVLKDLVLIAVTRWSELGLQLDVADSQLQAIKKNNQGNTEECKMDMFRAWLSNTINPSYSQLVEALEVIGEHTTAENLRKKFGETMKL